MSEKTFASFDVWVLYMTNEEHEIEHSTIQVFGNLEAAISAASELAKDGVPEFDYDNTPGPLVPYIAEGPLHCIMYSKNSLGELVFVTRCPLQ
jgi:hypothetical protein